MSKNHSPYHLDQSEKQRFADVLKVAETCQYEEEHTRHVTNLALQIFDQLHDLLNLGKRDKFYLLCAAYLHDIGVHTEGAKGHHKTALRIILSTPLLQFDSKERLLIGSIARYHRKALPSISHSHFAALEKKERELVSALAAILRIADGLDYRHDSRVDQVQVAVLEHKITFTCKTKKKNLRQELASAVRKSDLLEKVSSREIVFVEKLRNSD